MQYSAVPRVAAVLCLGLFLAAPAAAFWPFSPSPARNRVARPPVRVRIPGRDDGGAGRLVRLARALAADLASGVGRDPLAPAPEDGIVVTSFVELKDLRRTSSFGRYLGEELMGEMQRRGFRVVELRKGRGIRVAGGFGEYGLSRDPAEIAPAAAAAAVLTGTYTRAGDSVVVNARIVDNRSGDVIASAARVFPLDAALRAMLADAAAPGPRPVSPLYLKKLEM